MWGETAARRGRDERARGGYANARLRSQNSRACRSATAAHAGDVLAEIETAYTRRFTQFVRVAAGIVGDAERGRDAVQEAFARAIASRHDYRGDGPVDAWLWRVVTNVAHNQRRAASRMLLFDSVDEQIVAPADDTADARTDGVADLVAALPDRQRLVLFLRYFGDLSYAQIGAALDLRTGTVSATLAAAHRTLRAALEGAMTPGGQSRPAA